ncbi:MAG: NfeD family protein [Clostridiales bacterium]|nr:NfeD family protein [Clostridiales bacterium]
MNDTILWLILLVVLALIEIATLGLTTIWFAVGALVATIVAALGGPLWLQIALFLIASILVLIFLRPIAVKFFNKDREKTNVESLIGMHAVVVSEIDNQSEQGQAKLNGLDWMARSVDENITIPVGTVVTVLEVRGVKLIVEERKEEA